MPYQPAVCAKITGQSFGLITSPLCPVRTDFSEPIKLTQSLGSREFGATSSQPEKSRISRRNDSKCGNGYGKFAVARRCPVAEITCVKVFTARFNCAS